MKKYPVFRFLKHGVSGIVLLGAIVSCDEQTRPVNPSDLKIFERAKDSIMRNFDFFMTNRDYVNDKGITYYGGASFETNEDKLNKLYQQKGRPEFLLSVMALFKDHRIVRNAKYTSPLAINRDSTIAFCIKEENTGNRIVVEMLYYDLLDRPSRFGEDDVGRTDAIFSVRHWIYSKNTEPDVAK